MKIFKGIALALGLLVAIGLMWLLLIASHWLPRPTAAELEAIALLNSDAARVEGRRNAFAALYLLNREVPESRWEEIAAADLALLDHDASSTMTADSFPLTVELPTDRDALCTPKSRRCLERVRADVEAARAAVAQGRSLLDRAELLSRYDHYRSPIPARYNSPTMIGLGDYSTLALTEVALLHVDGESAAAQKKLCEFTSTWRTLRSNANTLIVNMLGTNYVGDAVALRAEMLAELPFNDAPLCPDVFDALSDSEMDVCAVMANEFHMFASGMRDINSPQQKTNETVGQKLDSVAGSRMFNVEHAVRLSAPFYASYCQADHRQRAAARSPTPMPKGPKCSVSAWAMNPIGCILVPIGTPAFASYYHRVLDLDARLRLLQAAQWLRQQDSADFSAAFASRPAGLDSPAHEFEIDADSKQLRMKALGRVAGETWEISYASAAASSEEISNSNDHAD